jgi:hypothetical protein
MNFHTWPSPLTHFSKKKKKTKTKTLLKTQIISKKNKNKTFFFKKKKQKKVVLYGCPSELTAWRPLPVPPVQN